MSQKQRRRRAKQRRHEHPRPSKRQLAAGAGLTIGATLAAGGTAHATDFTVTNLNPSGSGSLDQALLDANNAATDDRILFQSGLSGTITTTAQLDVADAVQILGPGPDQITVSGANDHRVFDVFTSGGNVGDDVLISGLTIANGQVVGNGAGVLSNYPDLTISNAVITGNTNLQNGGAGGGIAAFSGTLTLENSTISNNTVPTGNAFGGGIYTNDVPTVIRNSTITGNTANNDGGGLYVGTDQVPVLIQNSTFFANHATVDDAGAVYIANRYTAATRLVIQGSTLSGNTAASNGGAIQSYDSFGPDGYTAIYNTIVSGNTAIAGTDDIYGTVDAGFSLIRNPFAGTGFTINETVPGSNILGADPQLGPLASNGGPTQTMALPASSPAVDKGSAFGLTTDQRGVLRPIDFPAIANSSAAGADGSDIGAFELAPDNAMKLGKLKKNKAKGTAKQTVLIPLPDAGTVTISGKGLKRKTKQVADTGKVKLRVIPKGKKRRKVRRTGHVKVKEKITYKPTGAESKTLKKRVKLIKRLRHG